MCLSSRIGETSAIAPAARRLHGWPASRIDGVCHRHKLETTNEGWRSGRVLGCDGGSLTAGGEHRFQILSAVMKVYLLMPHSNADSERPFSMVNKIDTEHPRYDCCPSVSKDQLLCQHTLV